MTRGQRNVDPAQVRRVLHRTFGLATLREGQEPVINRVLSGLSTLALMPTGAGKSLCYQLPALMLEGCTVVISPLIALMKDQCDALAELGVPAVRLHSGLSVAELAASRQAIEAGAARIVFTTPEQLLHPEFIAGLRARGVALLVVDEAHCLSQWGFDFRPAFLEIGGALAALGRPPVLALTATATESVVADITELLAIPQAGVIGTDLYRPNLHYQAEHFSRAEDKSARLIERVLRSSGSGLVYVATVTQAVAVHAALAAAGEPAGLYHGRLGPAKRHAAQDAFMNGTVRVMVATNAFGLGIDKPDIRFVIHHQLPSGLDAYCQESGRAGRDGAVADCTLLFVDRDRHVQQFFLSGRYPQRHEFRAVVETLGQPPSDGTCWRLDTLVDRLGNRRKVAVAVNMLRQHGRLHADDHGRLALTAEAADPDMLAPLVAACADKALRDRAMLERMIAYAQSGRCRWHLLLEHLQTAPAMARCQTCDNCLRLAAHEAEQRRGIADRQGGDPIITQPVAFAIGTRVRTRRHGLADVVACDALSVTVCFANGQTRSFQPQFLSVAKSARRAPASSPAPARPAWDGQAQPGAASEAGRPDVEDEMTIDIPGIAGRPSNSATSDSAHAGDDDVHR